jgi:hypothetical protein
MAGDSLADQDRLALTATAWSPGGLAPSGADRFDSFEEADRWILEMRRRPRGRRSPKSERAVQTKGAKAA